MTDSKMLCPRCWGSRIEPGRDDRNCNFCLGDGVSKDVQLGPHFWLSEFVRSSKALRKGIPNDPSSKHIEELRSLVVKLLEPLRREFGSISIESGFRTLKTNIEIGGSESSVHMDGRAADIVPMAPGVTLKMLVDWMIKQDKLLFDQVIFEGTWVHVGHESPRGGYRRQALMMFMNSKKERVYSRYDPKDPRVTQ